MKKKRMRVCADAKKKIRRIEIISEGLTKNEEE